MSLQPNNFLVKPINGTDLIAVFRGNNINDPLYLYWRDLLAIIKQETISGSNFITGISSTPSINLSVVSGVLSAALTPIGTAGTYGDGSNVPQFTVDAQGRITGVTLVPIVSGAGTVTSVGISGTDFVITGSPVTTSGTINLSLANTGVTAGTYGGVTQIPVVTVDAKGRVTGITTVTIGSGSGTVTSVAVAASGALNATGSPITTAGTITLNWTGTTAQYVQGDGSLATFPTIPTVTPSALTKTDDTNVTLTLGGSPSNALLEHVSLTLNWAGVLAAARGGTGLGSIGTALQYLRVNALGTALEYANFPSVGTGTVTNVAATVPTPINPAFSVSVPNPTTTPSVNITANGNSTQYVDGTGALRTFPIVPPPESVYPYERRQYYKAGENRAMSFYQNKLFMANGTVNTVIVVDSETVDTLVTTGGLSTANTSVVLESMVTPEHWCTQLSAAPIVRHNAATGAFIANTTPTGVVTTGIQSKFLDFNATKAIGFNITNVYTINPTTFVTANLAAHGLNAAAQIPSGFVNRNPLSAQFEHAMIGSVNGIILYDCNTNAITVAATNLGGAIGTVLAVNYITSTDTWVIATLIGGLFRLVFVQVASATTFTVITTRRDIEPANITLPGGNINQVAIVIDEDFGYIFVVVNSRIYVLSLVTYLLLKSVNLSTIVGASVRPSVANIDRVNKRFFWCTGGSTFALTYEMLYA